MGDAFTPVASGIIPPDPNQGMKSLSAILGIQQQRQALQTGKALQSSAQSQAAVDSQSATENQSLARLLADPVGNGIVDSEGNPTKNAQSIVMRAAPTTGADAYGKVVNAAKSKIEFNGAVNTLKGNERKEIVDNITGSAASPDASYQDLKDNLTGLVDSKKGTPEYDSYKKIAAISTQGIDHLNQKEKDRGQIIPPGKEAWRGGAANLGRTILGAPGVVGAGGIAAPQQAQVDTGGQIQPGTTAPALAGGGFTPGGPPITKTTPPGVTTNASGQLVRVAPGGTGASIIPSAAPPGAPPGTPAPNANPTTATAAAQRGQAEAVTGRISQTLAQAANTVQAQDALSRAKVILESSESPDTGTFYEQRKALKNTMSALGIDTQGADNMNTLAKNLARFEASRATAAGLGGTDAARELAHNGSPNTQLDNKALQGIVRQSLATEKALSAYAKVQSSTNDPQQLLQNENSFRAIPHPIETFEYLMSRNKGEAERYLKEHGLSHADITKSVGMLKQFGAM